MRPVVILLSFVLLACEDFNEDSVVHLMSDLGDTTGFFYEPYRVMTVAHLIADESDSIKVLYDGEVTEATILEVDFDTDRMLLQVEPFGAPVRFCKPRIGQPVQLWGWLEDNDGPHNTQGVLYYKNKKDAFTTADSGAGFSGGPAVSNGCVIGMSYKYHTEKGWTRIQRLEGF